MNFFFENRNIIINYGHFVFRVFIIKDEVLGENTQAKSNQVTLYISNTRVWKSVIFHEANASTKRLHYDHFCSPKRTI